MAYSFYLGSSGSEKTERAFLDMIEASLEAPEERFFVLVPEQYSMLETARPAPAPCVAESGGFIIKPTRLSGVSGAKCAASADYG